MRGAPGLLPKGSLRKREREEAKPSRARCPQGRTPRGNPLQALPEPLSSTQRWKSASVAGKKPIESQSPRAEEIPSGGAPRSPAAGRSPRLSWLRQRGDKAGCGKDTRRRAAGSRSNLKTQSELCSGADPSLMRTAPGQHPRRAVKAPGGQGRLVPGGERRLGTAPPSPGGTAVAVETQPPLS